MLVDALATFMCDVAKTLFGDRLNHKASWKFILFS